MHRSLVVPILLYSLEVQHTEIAHRLWATQKAKPEACAALAETDDTAMATQSLQHELPPDFNTME